MNVNKYGIKKAAALCHFSGQPAHLTIFTSFTVQRLLVCSFSGSVSFFLLCAAVQADLRTAGNVAA